MIIYTKVKTFFSQMKLKKIFKGKMDTDYYYISILFFWCIMVLIFSSSVLTCCVNAFIIWNKHKNWIKKKLGLSYEELNTSKEETTGYIQDV